jgi:hypothetical protein
VIFFEGADGQGGIRKIDKGADFIPPGQQQEMCLRDTLLKPLHSDG